MNFHPLSLNPTSHKATFARRFLRALMRIKKNKHKPISSSSREIRRCSRRIKIAADTSMASAVGPKRAWSRAILFKLRRGAKHRALARKIRAGAKRKREVSNKEGFELKRANDLRRTVPGGEAMDFCSLLEETAHYIKCLTNQVQVMRSIADFYST